MSATERATPFYCPYCGDEDLRPQEEPPAAWLCNGCRRVFAVKFFGLNLGSHPGSAEAGTNVGSAGSRALPQEEVN